MNKKSTIACRLLYFTKKMCLTKTDAAWYTKCYSEVKGMEKVMTDFQFKKIIQMVLAILERSTDLQDAVDQINKLLKKDDNE